LASCGLAVFETFGAALSDFSQEPTAPHTCVAHWLAVRLACVDDGLDPLLVDPPPPHAATVRPVTIATGTMAILPAWRPRPARPAKSPCIRAFIS
jgi:hypothetical protein